MTTTVQSAASRCAGAGVRRRFQDSGCNVHPFVCVYTVGQLDCVSVLVGRTLKAESPLAACTETTWAYGTHLYTTRSTDHLSLHETIFRVYRPSVQPTDKNRQIDRPTD